MKHIIAILVATQLIAGSLLAAPKVDGDAEAPKKDTANAKEKTQAEDGKDDGKKEEKGDGEEAKEEKKSKTHKVKKETFRIELKLDGVFESDRTSEVSIPAKSWILLTVLEALPQGTKVKKGQSLVTLDFEKIDEKINDLRHDLRILDLDRSIATADLKLAEAVAPLKLAELERREKYSKEDLSRYEKVHRPFSERAAAMSLKSSKNSLLYVQEELDQLKKMYEADDLTEETEEIILLRAQNAVERAKFSLESAQIRNEESLKIDFPRKDVTIRQEAKQNELSVRSLRKIQPAELDKKRLEAKKLDEQKKKATENLSRLEADRKAMAVPSPASGILYRGTFDRGKWSGAAALKARLRRGGALKPNEVFMTIVESRPLFVRTDLSEGNLRRVKKNLKGKVKSKALPDLKLEGSVREVSAAPVSPGKFDLVVNVSLPKAADAILPGMSCKLEFVVYEKKDAIVVPASAVFSEEDDEDAKYVYLHREGKKPKKQTVKVGEKSGDKVEILEGIRAGKEILAEKPKD